MTKKIICLLLVVLAIFSVSSCREKDNNPDVPDISGGTNDDNNSNNGGNGDTQPDGTVEFCVSLIMNKQVYIPKDGEIITVIWDDGYAQHSKNLGSDGYAKIYLDGDFSVYLDGTPENYTYNPNIYTASNDEPVIQIELLRVSKNEGGNGSGIFKEYRMSDTGTYSAKITSKTKKVFYEYKPNKSGYYVIESLVNIHDDLINPKVDIYVGTFAYKNFSETIDDGGAYLKGGYTKNFKWIVNITDDRVGNVYTFAIGAETKTGVYPVNVDFKISYEGEYYEDITLSKLMVAEEANTKAPDMPSDKYVFVNSDGSVGNYNTGSITQQGSGILNGNNFKYNEETGFWHVYNSKTNEYGAILCAKIAQPCTYYDPEGALNMIEYHGNKNLTVSNGTENYKQFIENQYTAVCNSDGVCYVTMELMEFLQKFSVSQRLFFDGNGFVEQYGVYAIEEDQWLFACGYYVEK